MAVMLVARLGIMRLGASRLGYYRARPLVQIGGVNRTSAVRLAGITITDELDHEPNTASFRVDGTPPVVGQEVRIYLATNADQPFGGHVLSVKAVYELKPANLAWDVRCIDYTWLLGKRPVLTRFRGQSATTILNTLIGTYAPGFSTGYVAPGLPVLDEITFQNEELATAITRVMERIGGYWYIDAFKDLHAFITQTEVAAPITQAVPRTMKNIAQEFDLSQVVTRVTARGGGSNVLDDIEAGATSLPVEDASWYPVTGGVVELGQQRAAYTGVGGTSGLSSTSGGSLLVAAPAAPSAAVSTTPGKPMGVLSYKTTFVVGGGETLPSAASAAITAGRIAPDGLGLTLTEISVAGVADWPIGTVLRYRYAFIGGPAAGVAGRASNPITIASSGASGGSVDIVGIPIGPTGTTGRRLYRSVNGGPYFEAPSYNKYIAATPTVETNNTSTHDVDAGPDQIYSNNVVPVEGGTQVNLTGIAIGPAGTTARRLYRTASGGSVYKLVATINDNTTTTFTDDVADASLGNEALTYSEAATPVGGGSLAVYDLAMFPTAGWVRVGQQFVRYTGRSGAGGAGTLPGVLTGLPASGGGSVRAPIAAGALVEVVPYLTGVTGIVFDVLVGEPVNVIVTVDDVAAQATLASYLGGDGITEGFITDGRWSVAECTAEAQAELLQRKEVTGAVTFASRDPSLQSGRSITINLTSPAIVGTFKIQRVTITGFHIPNLLPLRQVECAARRYSFEDLLRQMRGRAA